jgi:hypothetical protein
VWDAWDRELPEHVTALRRRYEVAVGR